MTSLFPPFTRRASFRKQPFFYEAGRGVYYKSTGYAPALNLNFTTGTLDSRITFSRGSNATLVDSTGKITYAPANLLQQSQNFATTWVSGAGVGFGAVTINTTATAAPDGSVTGNLIADNSTANNNYGMIQNNVSILASTTYNVSIYAKKKDYDYVVFNFNTGTNRIAYYNLSTGVVSNTSNVNSATMTNVGNGWWRLNMNITSGAAQTSVNFIVIYCDTNSTSTHIGVVGQGTYLWGAQIEPVTYQTTPSTYVATTASAYYGPRFDYDPVTLACKGLLIEEQRTNLLLRSAEFNNAASWVPISGATVAGNTVTAPDGTVTGDTITFNTTNGNRFEQSSGTAVNGETVTFSLWMKGSGTIRLNVGTDTGVGGSTETSFTLTSNWVRYSVTVTYSSPTGVRRVMIIWRTGDTATNVDVWGAQLEAGSFATSYIPTTTATVTRSADVASMTGSNFTSWYNQSQGTFVSQFDMVGGSAANPNNQIVLSAVVDASNRHLIYNGSSQITGYTVVGGVDQAYLTMGSLAANVASRMAYAYQVNDFAASKDGGAVSTDTSGSLPSPITLGVGSSGYSTAYLNGHIASIQYYNKRLPNATLQQLTSPSLVPSMSLVFDTSSNSYIDANWSP